MSYFICSFQGNPKHTEEAENSLLKMVPSERRDASYSIKNSDSYFISYGTDKVIPDVKIRNEKNESWLVLTGTPLLTLNSNMEEQKYLTDFLSNPKKMLRDELHGSYAAFCYDAELKRLIVATDYNNTIPIYYSVTSDGILFSSHELALARCLRPKTDPYGFSLSIQMEHIWTSHTRFEGIQKLVVNQMCIVDEKRNIHTEYYWQPSDENIWSYSFDDCMDKWNSIMSDCILKYFECGGKKPVMCDLTAGEDTRLIVAHCHALGIPFSAQVMGTPDNIDVIIAKEISNKVGIELLERKRLQGNPKQIMDKIPIIPAVYDGCQQFFWACADYSSNIDYPLDDYKIVKYCGAFGGAAFRGGYYLRGKAFFPSRIQKFDYKFFVRLKYLLDFTPKLMQYPDDAFVSNVHNIAKEVTDKVSEFPLGTQVDHMQRELQNCYLVGLKYKNPLYVPYGSNHMVRSIYNIPPNYKKGSRLTRACTEKLFPNIAFINTQKGIPTIRRTFSRIPLFFPEYISKAKSIINGFTSRLYKWKKDSKWYYSQDWNNNLLMEILKNSPYSKWFASPDAMITGQMYKQDKIKQIITDAKAGSCRNMAVIARILNQEFVFRWVNSDGID